jgi:photosystem II stability/assembly factor-like uncharacterized protein
VIIAIGWQLISNRSNSTDPTVAGRPLSNPQTHLHTLALSGNGNDLYLGTHFGLFVSHDAGGTWPQPRGALASAMITSIALAADDPRVIAVIALPSGIGSIQPGVYLSRDGGQQWQNVSPPHLPAAAYPFAVKAGSGSPGHFYAFYAYAGWYETSDMGQHWQAITAGALSSMETSLLLSDPEAPRHLLLGGDQGLYETHDDGQHWQHLTGVSGTVLSLTATTTTPRQVFCATDQGLYRWQEGSTPPRISHLALSFLPTRLVSSADGRALYAVAGHDLWYSGDGGTTWSLRGHFGRSDLMALALNPRNSERLYAAFFYPAAVLTSSDGGRSWQVLTD